MWGYQIIAFGGVGIFLYAFLTCLSRFRFEPHRYEPNMKKLCVLFLMIGFGGLAIQSFGLFMLLLNDVFLQQDYAAETIQSITHNLLLIAGSSVIAIILELTKRHANFPQPPILAATVAFLSGNNAIPWIFYLLA